MTELDKLLEKEQEIGALKRARYVIQLIGQEVEWVRAYHWTNVNDGIAVLDRLRALLKEVAE